MFFRKALGLFSLGNILRVATVVLVLYMGSGFVKQIGTHLQVQADLEQLEQRQEAARQENALLREELEYTQSPEAVEAWARENGMARSDEVSIAIVAPPASPDRQEGDDLQGDDSAPSGPEVWWSLFFGEDQ
jgi:cell division protein FtsB